MPDTPIPDLAAETERPAPMPLPPAIAVNAKPVEPPPARFHVRALRYGIARLKEPVTWVSLGFLWNCIQDNMGNLWTVHGLVQVGGGVCAVIMKSPGSPWESHTFFGPNGKPQ